MNKEKCALKLVNEIILYYDARSKKHEITIKLSCVLSIIYIVFIIYAFISDRFDGFSPKLKGVSHYKIVLK